MFETKIKADKDPKEQMAQSAYNYNPIYQKLTKLTWNAPSGGYHYYGPPPDVGTSYGMWWDSDNKFGVIAPLPSSGTTLYSPASGNEMNYEGPALQDALYQLYNYTGPYEFVPRTRSGDTYLTTAPIFSANVDTMYSVFTGADITEEFKAMKANRTQGAPAPAAAPVKAQASAKSLKSDLGADKHKGLDKGNLNPATDSGGSDADEHKVPMKTQARYTSQQIEAMTESQLTDALLQMFSYAAEEAPAEESAPAAEAPAPAPEKSAPAPKSEKSAPAPAPKSEKSAPKSAPKAEPTVEAPPSSPEGEDALESPPAMDAEESAAPEAPAMEGEGAEPAPEAEEGAPAAPAPAAPPAAPAPAAQPAPAAPPAAPAAQSPAAPAAEPPAAVEETKETPSQKEAPTPSTRPTLQKGIEAMTTASTHAKEMKALALKLLSDPDYLTKNEAEVNARVKEAEEIIAAKKSKSGDGFYGKSEIKEAHDKAEKKMEGGGFYTEHIDQVREKTLKEIEKVSSMIDDQILAALEQEVTAESSQSSSHSKSKSEGSYAAKSGMSHADESADGMGAAMADIEKMIGEMGLEEGEESHHMSKSEHDAGSVQMEELHAELAALEASLATAEEMEEMALPPSSATTSEGKHEPASHEKHQAKSTAVEPISMEPVASVAELEAEGPITAAAVNMHLYGHGGLNPFWNITANGEPVGRVYLQDQADPETDRNFFTSAKYADGVVNAIEKIGLKDTLASINAKLFSNRIEKSEIVQKVQAEADKVIKATVATKTASLRDELVDRMMVAQSALDKNMFKDEGNALKDALFMQMKKFGVSNPVPYIEAAFEAGATDYFKLILAKAVEFLDMEPKAFEQIKRTVANSDVLTPPDVATASSILPEATHTTLAAHLASNQMPLSFSQPVATGTYSDLKETLRLGLSLKKKV